MNEVVKLNALDCGWLISALTSTYPLASISNPKSIALCRSIYAIYFSGRVGTGMLSFSGEYDDERDVVYDDTLSSEIDVDVARRLT